MVRGPVRKQSMDPVRSGGPRTGDQSLRVTRFLRRPRYFLRITVKILVRSNNAMYDSFQSLVTQPNFFSENCEGDREGILTPGS